MFRQTAITKSKLINIHRKNKVLEQSIIHLFIKNKNRKQKLKIESFYFYLKIKQYLKPNQVKSSKEEIQLIFKLRCRVTETKKNYQGMYDEFLCD